MRGVSLLNITIWVFSYVRLRDVAAGTQTAHASSDQGAYIMEQLSLSLVYTVVCAYRSWWPRIDLERYVLVDSVLSSIFLGRLSATVAEVSFARQVSLLVSALGVFVRQHSEVGAAAETVAGLCDVLSTVLVPVLAVAQCCCWYSVVTLSHLGHAVEESLWLISFFGVGAVTAGAWSVLGSMHETPVRWMCLGVACSCAVYVLFMGIVDVPMYVSRWRAQASDAKQGIVRGVADSFTRRVHTQAYAVWKPEFAWLALYFSVAVWGSIAMAHAPLFA